MHKELNEKEWYKFGNDIGSIAKSGHIVGRMIYVASYGQFYHLELCKDEDMAFHHRHITAIDTKFVVLSCDIEEKQYTPNISILFKNQKYYMSLIELAILTTAVDCYISRPTEMPLFDKAQK